MNTEELELNIKRFKTDKVLTNLFQEKVNIINKSFVAFEWNSKEKTFVSSFSEEEKLLKIDILIQEHVEKEYSEDFVEYFNQRYKSNE